MFVLIASGVIVIIVLKMLCALVYEVSSCSKAINKHYAYSSSYIMNMQLSIASA